MGNRRAYSNGNDSALTFCGQSYVEIRKSNGEIIKLFAY